ncbi:MAG: phosphoribosyltransferase, partial [Planctomycetes bacterium]|nr:phosphoribosyltransferase [Planctomycetota bacterium]
KDRIVIVTDDGIATGATMEAALWAVRQEGPKQLIAALPVGPDDSLHTIAEYADETLCLQSPAYFGALGSFYLRFEQVEDFQMLEILQHEAERRVVK